MSLLNNEAIVVDDIVQQLKNSGWPPTYRESHPEAKINKLFIGASKTGKGSKGYPDIVGWDEEEKLLVEARLAARFSDAGCRMQSTERSTWISTVVCGGYCRRW